MTEFERTSNGFPKSARNYTVAGFLAFRQYQKDWQKSHRKQARAATQKWRKAHPEHLEKRRSDYEANPGRWKRWFNRENRREACERFRKKFPEKARAHQAVKRALKKGTLKRQPCEKCGAEERVQAHHPDYSKPLDVQWLCIKHHSELSRRNVGEMMRAA